MRQRHRQKQFTAMLRPLSLRSQGTGCGPKAEAAGAEAKCFDRPEAGRQEGVKLSGEK